MRQKDVVKMLHKVEEVKALFVFGARVIPYLEELVLFVKETAPILEEMNQSIEDSSKKMPFAVQKLDKVTETTETATAGMLDRIDSILVNVDDVTAAVEEIETEYNTRLDKEKELILKLARALDGDDETDAASVEEELKNLVEMESQENMFSKIKDSLALMQTEAYDIMNSLQIQDITSQQIMAANSLIEAVQRKLGGLLSRFSDIEIDDVPQKKQRAFDPNAAYEDRSHVQAMADSILAGDEVDEVMTHKVTEVDPPKSSTKKPATENSSQGNVSQDEIDKLLNDLKG